MSVLSRLHVPLDTPPHSGPVWSGFFLAETCADVLNNDLMKAGDKCEEPLSALRVLLVTEVILSFPLLLKPQKPQVWFICEYI